MSKFCISVSNICIIRRIHFLQCYWRFQFISSQWQWNDTRCTYGLMLHEICSACKWLNKRNCKNCVVSENSFVFDVRFKTRNRIFPDLCIWTHMREMCCIDISHIISRRRIYTLWLLLVMHIQYRGNNERQNSKWIKTFVGTWAVTTRSLYQTF